MTSTRTILLALTLSCLVPGPALAGFEEALQNHAEGDRVTAFQGFQAAAEAGDVRAFGKLGGMYLYGAGTEQDYGQAYLWFGLAALTGDQYAESFQQAAATRLGPEELPELDRLIERKAARFGLGGPQEIPTIREVIRKRGGVFGPELPLQQGSDLPTLDSQ